LISWPSTGRGECDLLAIEDGLWQHRKDASEDQASRCEPGSVIDDYLNSAHRAIGLEVDFDIADGRNDAEQGTVENYWQIALEFARLDRAARRAIGDKLLEKMQKADKTGSGYGVVLLPNKTAVVVLASADDGPRRSKGLFNLCAAVYCGLKPRKVLGFGTEPLSVSSRTYSTMCLEGVTFENADELEEHFRQSFRHPCAE
jgi:hypothetical protein